MYFDRWEVPLALVFIATDVGVEECPINALARRSYAISGNYICYIIQRRKIVICWHSIFLVVIHRVVPYNVTILGFVTLNSIIFCGYGSCIEFLA